METLLNPINRKSFYGKAVAIDNGDTIQCRSYDTIVAEYDKVTDTITINGWYSSTTSRHLDAFCKYVGKSLVSKQDKEDQVSY